MANNQYRRGAKGVILDKHGKRVYGPEEATIEAADRIPTRNSSGNYLNKNSASTEKKLVQDKLRAFKRIGGAKGTQRLSSDNPEYRDDIPE